MYTIRPPWLPGVTIQCDHPEEVIEIVDRLNRDRAEADAKTKDEHLGFGFVGVGGDHWERRS